MKICNHGLGILVSVGLGFIILGVGCATNKTTTITSTQESTDEKKIDAVDVSRFKSTICRDTFLLEVLQNYYGQGVTISQDGYWNSVDIDVHKLEACQYNRIYQKVSARGAMMAISGVAIMGIKDEQAKLFAAYKERATESDSKILLPVASDERFREMGDYFIYQYYVYGDNQNEPNWAVFLSKNAMLYGVVGLQPVDGKNEQDVKDTMYKILERLISKQS